MTLVAFTVDEHRAEIVTDGLSYAPECVDVTLVEKCHVLPALDLAVTAIGPSELGQAWAGLLNDCVEAIPDLDQLDLWTPTALRELWRKIGEERERDGGSLRDGAESGCVFQVGWSPQRGRFVGYAYDLSEDFERVDVTDHALYCRPVPSSHIPPEVPTTPGQWAALVKACHADWTLSAQMAGPKVFIGGDVVRTRLARGVHDQQTIHTFPMRGAQWRRSVIGTLHPDGQLGPCLCGSGLPHATCHLLPPERADAPCPCVSGRSLRDCHLIAPGDPRVLAHYRAHRKDYELTRPELAATYRRRRPAENWPPERILRLNAAAYR